MHDEAIDGTQLMAWRVEHVKVRWLFGVEAVQCGSGTEAGRHDGARRQILTS